MTVILYPSHGGHMAQVGLNLGPCHARVLGWGKQCTKNLDDQTKLLHDLDIVGAVSLMWSLICSIMPLKILEQIDDRLKWYDLPCLATRHVGAGWFPVQKCLTYSDFFFL